ncbi:2-hydroxyisoflavanone dehydratase-like [Salvia hispanica]|uniref:2-hydroxyisoflavanone dehydratase-like n=1 Tax=Salvia hispanica TaxID=49212 RepID=UPI00200996F6|nr:2-hydroxyisoflavanone dehydratase-like [Salvia hispanica]
MAARRNLSLIFFLAFSTLHSLSLSLSQSQSDPTILYDIYPFIRVYKNGTIQRFIGQDFSPPSTDPATGVQSKDVHFSHLSARLYLPTNPSAKLPLLIYFHGGGFFTESAFSPTYHRHLTSLVAAAKIAAVSVNYRLAPEHPLPAAYSDAWLALQWTFSRSDPWIKNHADLGKIYLGGDSAGANIAHRMSIRVGSGDPAPGINLRGMFLNCPYFLGKKEIGNESGDAYTEEQMRKLWVYAYPGSEAGLDNPLVNPGMDPGLRRVGCGRVLVYVAGKDVLRFRGKYYAAALRRSGWKGGVKVVEVEGESHVFNLINPNTPKAAAMIRVLAAFLNHS